jgi:hypothetical protein
MERALIVDADADTQRMNPGVLSHYKKGATKTNPDRIGRLIENLPQGAGPSQ